MSDILQLPHLMRMINILDILLVVGVILLVFRWMRGTKAIAFMNAAVVLFLIYAFSRYLNLVLFIQLLNLLSLIMVVSLPIIFQSELKRVIEMFGENNPLIKRFVAPPVIATESIEIIVTAAATLAQKRIGALIVLQQHNFLSVVHQSGARIDAVLSAILIEQLFYPSSPLHDGAIVIKDNRIQAAGCFLPLDNELELPQELGSRHRAGLSLAAQTDALVVIISEETGKISLAYNGSLAAYTQENLAFKLKELLHPETEPAGGSGPSQTNDGKTEAI
ncbi:MAG: diadenylate cyclase CdaA [Bacillota bacterium]